MNFQARRIAAGNIWTTTQASAHHLDPMSRSSIPSMMSSLVGCIERHARLPAPLVVQAETLGLGGEFVSDRLPVSIVDAFVGEQVGQQDAATVADAPVRKLAFL